MFKGTDTNMTIGQIQDLLTGMMTKVDGETSEFGSSSGRGASPSSGDGGEAPYYFAPSQSKAGQAAEYFERDSRIAAAHRGAKTSIGQTKVQLSSTQTWLDAQGAIFHAKEKAAKDECAPEMKILKNRYDALKRWLEDDAAEFTMYLDQFKPAAAIKT